MKINWKVRFKNKMFVSALISAIFLIITNIPTVSVLLPSWCNESVAQGILSILTLGGIFIDPTTYGLYDSEQAMEYSEPKKDKDEVDNKVDNKKNILIFALVVIIIVLIFTL